MGSLPVHLSLAVVLNELIITVKEWLNLGQPEMLSNLLGIMTFILLASSLTYVFFKGLIFLLRHAIEGIKQIVKMVGILVAILLILMVFQTILNPSRPCRWGLFESYFTRCTLSIPPKRKEASRRDP